LWQILERGARVLGKTKEADDYAAKIGKARKLIHTTSHDLLILTPRSNRGGLSPSTVSDRGRRPHYSRRAWFTTA
jgi:hypothetical protein